MLIGEDLNQIFGLGTNFTVLSIVRMAELRDDEILGLY